MWIFLETELRYREQQTMSGTFPSKDKLLVLCQPKVMSGGLNTSHSSSLLTKKLGCAGYLSIH